MKHLDYLKDRYVVLKEFIPKQFALYFSNYLDLIDKNEKLQEGDGQVDKSKTIYGDPAFDTLLAMACGPLSEIIQVDLYPTYTYARIYLNDSELLPHIDRPECEHSVSICLFKEDGVNWPLYFQKENNEVESVELEIGDAVVYRGSELAHWREKYVGKNHYQLFMHYVDSQGKFKDNLFDNRPNLGLPADTKTKWN